MNITTKNIINDKNPIIRQKSQIVNAPYSDDDINLALDLHTYVKNSQDETFVEKYQLKPAVGIAAPQIGILKKIFAVVVYDENNQLHEYALINPKMISHSTKRCYLSGGEGCLSVDEKHVGNVPRYFKVKIQAFDCLTKSEVTITAKGYLAIVLQHEYDHLNGVLFYDHIDEKNPLKPIEDAIEI